MISIILISPEHEGNVGAVARVMKNFGFGKLFVVNPKCDPTGNMALARSKHAKDILLKAKVGDEKLLKKFDYIIGTTARLGSDYNIPRSPVTPEQLANKIVGKRKKFALLFGREGSGLTNEEIKMCDFIVTIPTSPKYPVMNLSQSVSVVLYELFKHQNKKKIAQHIIPISAAEKKQILKMVDKVLTKMPFRTEDKKETQRVTWKRLLGKSMLTKREAYAIMGFLRKLI